MATKVYLAGGFRGGWQDKVIEAFSEPFGAWLDVEFVDPRKHGLKEEKDYTEWDLRAIRECDVVFAVIPTFTPRPFVFGAVKQMV